MSSSELGRRVRQQGADIDSLYEIRERIDTKIDDLRAHSERRFNALDQQMQSNRELLTQILQRLQA